MQEARSYRGVSRRRDLSTLKIPRRRAEADSVCQLELMGGGAGGGNTKRPITSAGDLNLTH